LEKIVDPTAVEPLFELLSKDNNVQSSLNQLRLKRRSRVIDFSLGYTNPEFSLLGITADEIVQALENI